MIAFEKESFPVAETEGVVRRPKHARSFYRCSILFAGSKGLCGGLSRVGCGVLKSEGCGGGEWDGEDHGWLVGVVGNLGLDDGDDGVWFHLLDLVGHVGTLNFAAELDNSQ